MTGSRTLEARVESRPSDPYLFAAHDAVNVLVLLVVFGLPHAASPVVLMITPRLYHKRLIKNPNVDIERERRLAFWLDSSFIVVMTLGIGALAASMVWKVALF